MIMISSTFFYAIAAVAAIGLVYIALDAWAGFRRSRHNDHLIPGAPRTPR